MLRVWLQLVKLRITIASMVTTAVGYVVFRGQFDVAMLPVLGGIFLQACGAAALNQVQDAALDTRMGRTAGRPLPAGRISRKAALAGSLLLLGVGSALLVVFYGLLPAMLGLAAAVVYNGIYTPLKRVTPFAALPGAVVGALPPAAGWVAAGGYLADPALHQVMFFFFLWQMPHFWLLLLHYQRDYRAAGLPSLFDRFDARQIGRLTFTWIAAVVVAGVLMPLFSLIDAMVPRYLVAVAGLAVVLRSVVLLRPVAEEALDAPLGRMYKVRFMEINTFVLVVCGVLVVEGLG
ncbi:protoheme IX farnesyltransferase [bacterium]|nr:MAG: protoheme IX farnesyltransferase [bacterium]